MQYASWLFMLGSLLGAYINSRGNLFLSSIIWLCANLFWLVTDATAGLIAQSVLYFAFIVMNIIGIRTALKNRKRMEYTRDIGD